MHGLRPEQGYFFISTIMSLKASATPPKTVAFIDGQNRWIKIASAYPKNTSQKHLNRGINKTDWIPFEKALYDTCLDPRDYRPKP